jgi:hypothetical protein
MDEKKKDKIQRLLALANDEESMTTLASDKFSKGPV